MTSNPTAILARIDELMIDLMRQLATQAEALSSTSSTTPSQAAAAERAAKRTRTTPKVSPLKLLTFASTDDGGRGESNISFPTKSVVGMRRFAQVMRVLELVQINLVLGRFVTKRDIYYQSLHLFPSQQASDRTITHLLTLLQCDRTELNIVASPRGLVCGALTITPPTAPPLECSAGQPMLIPPEISAGGEGWSVDLHCPPHCPGHTLLVVEKEAVFKHLLQQPESNTIMVTAKGYPDLATRRLLQLLTAACSVRVVGLFDGDPYGVDVYRQYCAGVTVEWIGVDVEDFEPEGNALVQLRNDERATGVRLLRKLGDSPEDERMR